MAKSARNEAYIKRLLIDGVALGGTDITATAAELNIMDGVTATTAEINRLDGYPAGMNLVVAEQVSFTETTGAGTYTGSINIPAGATIVDIKVRSTALWDTATSATMIVGDVTDPDGYFAAVDLKATDLLVGEEINFVQTGGKQGAYLDTTTGKRTNAYSASARVLSGVITTVGASGSAGRTTMTVLYTTPTSVAATKAS